MKHHRDCTSGATLLATGLRLAGLSLALLLAACGGGGGSAGSPMGTPASEFDVSSGGAACGTGGCGGDSGDGGGVGSGGDGGDGGGGGLGEMRNVRVTVAKPDGTVLGSAVLQNNLVSLYPRTYTGPIVLEFADDGTGTARYYDEGLEVWIALGTNKLHVMVPSLTHHISANPLTEAAYQWALSRTEGALNAAAMTSANNYVRDAFNARLPQGYQITDVTNYAVAVSDLTVPNSLPNTHAGRFGTVLAALPRVGLAFNSTLAAPAVSFMNELTADVLDSFFDAQSAINASAPEVAYGPDIAQALAIAITSARADYAVAAQPVPSSSVASICMNPALYKVGAISALTYLNTDQQQVTTRMTYTTTLTRLTSFQNVASALEAVLSVSDGTTMVTTNSYFDPDLSAGIVNYGSTAPNALGSSLSVYGPPNFVDGRFLLQPDSSQSIDTTLAVTLFDTAGKVLSGPTSTRFAQNTTFVGYEDVTLASGQLFRNACHYQTSDVASGSTDNSWYTASGQGVAVKTVTTNALGLETGRSELIGGNVNGYAVH